MKKWIRAALIAIAIFLSVMALEGGFSTSVNEYFLRFLCDAFFVPGVLLSGAGLLRLVSAHGTFDALSYTTRKAFDQLRREENRNRTAKTYFDYVTEQRGKKRAIPAHLLVTGLVFLAASVITLAVYLTQYP